MTVSALNEPNAAERNTLSKLEKTIEDLFMESTFKLNIDFKIIMIWWDYNDEGWQTFNTTLSVGDQNFQKVGYITQYGQRPSNEIENTFNGIIA